jgi:hypothetical protein
MWINVLTKPKQGKGFRAMWIILMNVAEGYDDEMEYEITPPYLLTATEHSDSESNDTDISPNHVPMTKNTSRV